MSDTCILCAQDFDTWPCGVSWDAEHRPRPAPVPPTHTTTTEDHDA